MRDLGFSLSELREAEVVRGKDFVEIKDGPFDVDLIFAPDGIENFEDAWNRRVEIEIRGDTTQAVAILNRKEG